MAHQKLHKDPAQVGCFELATLFEAGDLVARDRSKARGLYDALCKAHQPKACFRLSHVLASMAPAATSNKAAKAAMELACRYGHKEACSAVDCFGLINKKKFRRRLSSPSAKLVHRFYETLCTAGNGMACVLRDRDLFFGHGVSSKANRAKRSLAKLCERGQALACDTLGDIYFVGYWGSKAEPETAKPYLEKSCAAGSARACGRLGEVLWRSPGKEKLGVNYVRRACDGGHLPSCLEMRTGRGAKGQVSASQVGVALAQACKGGALLGCVKQAALSRDRFGKYSGAVPPRVTMSVSCSMGYSGACAHMAGLFFRGEGGLTDLARVRHLGRASCLCGNGYGCYLAGVAFSKPVGERLPAPRAAVKYLKSACEKGLPLACYEQAKILMGGKGVDIDIPMAQRLLWKACHKAGHPDSCALLKKSNRELSLIVKCSLFYGSGGFRWGFAHVVLFVHELQNF